MIKENENFLAVKVPEESEEFRKVSHNGIFKLRYNLEGVYDDTVRLPGNPEMAEIIGLALDIIKADGENYDIDTECWMWIKELPQDEKWVIIKRFRSK
jgi:hypothetical protein